MAELLNSATRGDLDTELGPIDHTIVEQVRVTMIATFGPVVRGVSMYADELSTALHPIKSVRVNQIDYAALYPSLFMPTTGPVKIGGDSAIIDWASPASWRAAAWASESIAHIQYWSLPTSYVLAAVAKHLRALGKRVVVTVHNPSPHERLLGLTAWERRLFERADAIIAHTVTGKNQLLMRYPKLIESTINVIPHGVTLQTQTRGITDDFRRAKLDPRRRYVLIFGNLRGYKGLSILLRAWKNVIAKETETDLVIAGRLWSGGTSLPASLAAHLLGSRRVALDIKKLLSDEELARRVILKDGFIEEDEIDALCRVADIGVFPYERFSGQSGAASRAAGWGLPILVSDVGGLPELVPNAYFVIPPKDPQSLSGRLLELLNNSNDLALHRRAQQEHLVSATWDKVAQQHAALYMRLSQVVSNKHQSPN